VHHPRSRDLRATLHLKQLSSAGVAQPHFLIECEDLRSAAAARTGPASSRLPHLAQLTSREQEVARLVCEGRSNQEIADDACLSLPMVKKHLHAVFRKLEVPSRSRLMALIDEASRRVVISNQRIFTLPVTQIISENPEFVLLPRTGRGDRI